jgi:hypothetical protein
MLNYLHFKMLYSTRQSLDALFLINVFKNKIDCCSIMIPLVSVYQLSKLETPTIFNVSNLSRLSPSTRCVTAANYIYKSPDVFNKHNISIEDTFSFA